MIITVCAFCCYIFFVLLHNALVASSRAGACSIAAALKLELQTGNPYIHSLFFDNNDGEWKEINSQEYATTLELLRKRHTLDISKKSLDSWGNKYVIEVTNGNGFIVCRVSSFGRDQIRSSEDIMQTFKYEQKCDGDGEGSKKSSVSENSERGNNEDVH